jgi:hypothetical protein
LEIDLLFCFGCWILGFVAVLNRIHPWFHN